MDSIEIESELEKLIIKAMPLPTCPQTAANIKLMRVWLKSKIVNLYTPQINQVGPSLTK